MKLSGKNISRDFLIGMSFIIAAYLCAAVMNAFAKIAGETINLGVILFFQNFISLLCFLPLAFKKGLKGLYTRHIGLHIIRALSGLLSYALLFYAIQRISLLNGTLLGNAAPLFLPFVVWVWLGKKIHSLLWVSLIVGFLGVVFILDPSMDIFTSWMILVALLASLFSAIALQSVSILKKTESTVLIILYYMAFASLCTLPFALFSWVGPTTKEWLLLLGIGVTLALTQFFLTEAYHYGTPAELGPFNYSVIVFAGLIQWWIWHQIPTFMSLIGIILVCLGGILTILWQKRYQR